MQEDHDGIQKHLVFGGTLKQPFSPDKLALSKRSGRLYHELTNNGSKLHSGVIAKGDEKECSTGIGNEKGSKQCNLTPLHASDVTEYGLIRSSLAVTLSEHIVDGTLHPNYNDDSIPGSEKEYSGMDYLFDVTGGRVPIAWLPEYAEPGPWSLPFDDDGAPLAN